MSESTSQGMGASESAAHIAPLADAVQLIDHRAVTWTNVRHSQYWMHKRFHYAYPGPIRELHQRLMVLPPASYGDQTLSSYSVAVHGAPYSQQLTQDRFGNQVLSLYLAEAPQEISFEVTLQIERMGYPHMLPRLSAEEVAPFRCATALTAADERLTAAARMFQKKKHMPLEQAAAINTWVWQQMKYGAGLTSVSTSAAEALEIGQGLCQDYAHIMLAICRAAGLPARYVSGHLLGEGGSHAWVEVLVPQVDGSFSAVPFDPTNHRRANLSYITIAAGRDYRDVPPTSGSYTAPYAGRLTASKRAGVTRVEYIAA